MLSPRVLVLALALTLVPAVARPQTVPGTLAWDYTQPGAITGFRIWRYAAGAAWADWQFDYAWVSPAPVQWWTDPAPILGATTCYRVVAEQATPEHPLFGTSAPATLVCAPDQGELCVTIPAAP